MAGPRRIPQGGEGHRMSAVDTVAENVAAAPSPAPSAEEIVHVHAETTSAPGRFLVHARDQHLVSDARTGAGGPGEAIQAGELLLAALASCGLALVQKAAREEAPLHPVSDARVDVSFERDPADGTRYRFIRLVFELEGVDQARAEALVSAFTGTCPIYNTLRRGGNVEAIARAA